MKKLALAAVAVLALSGAAHAQFPSAQPNSIYTVPLTTPEPMTSVPVTPEAYRAATNGPQAIGAPLTTAPAVSQQAESGGVINVGQAFGFLAPYINSAIGALITAGLSWLFYLIQKRLGISIDEGNRDAIHTALQNAAASLLADGAVHLEGKKVTVGSAEMANVMNEVMAAAPTAVAHFGLTPELLKQKIIDKIPQVPAGAALIAVANKPAAPTAV